MHVLTGMVGDLSLKRGCGLRPLYLGGLLARRSACQYEVHASCSDRCLRCSASVDTSSCHTKICCAVQAQIASPTRIIRDWIDCSDWCGHVQRPVQKHLLV